MNKKIISHIATTFAFSWFLWCIVAVAGKIGLVWLSYEGIVGKILYIFGGCAPAICELWMQKRNNSKAEFHRFLKRIIDVKQSAMNYLYAIGGAMLLMGVPVLLGYGTFKSPLHIGFLLIVPMIIGGGIEEIGWRGFMQPELEKTISHWKATLLVSCVWAVWHLPLWWIEGTNQFKMSFLWFCINAVTLSFFIGSVSYLSNSISMAILAHASINSFWEVWQPTSKLIPSIIILVVVATCTLILDALVAKLRVHNQSE